MNTLSHEGLKKKKSQNTAARDQSKLLGDLVPLCLGFLIWKSELLSVLTTLGAYCDYKISYENSGKMRTARIGLRYNGAFKNVSWWN